MRLISICPSNTELVAYLGLTEKLVGIDDFSDWPKEIEHLPRLGPDLNIDMDKLEQLEPDLVLASLTVPGMEKNVAELEKRRIPYVVYQPNSLDEIKETILDLAKLTNTVERGEAIVKRYDEIIQIYETLSKDLTPKELYWEWWPKPVFTPGKQNWLTYISELAGGENIFSTEDVASYQTTWEDVYNRDPNHICLVWVGVQKDKIKPDQVVSRPNWEHLQAVKDGFVHVLDEPLFCRPSPRLLEGLVKLGAILHPDIFPAYSSQDPILSEIK